MNYSNDSNKRRKRKSKAPVKKTVNFAGTIVMRVVVLALIVGVFAACGAGIGIYLGIIKSSAAITNDIEVTPDVYTTFIYEEKTGKELDRLHGDENRVYVKLKDIPVNLQNAVIAIEDERFYTHNGIDFKGMLRAVYTNLASGDLSEGASTITQQLIKNNIIKDFSKNFKRKLQEQYIAVQYEEKLTKELGGKKEAKDYILELYLNSIGLNHGLVGVQAAANFYYGKEVSELTLAQCAVIAAITQYPVTLTPLKYPENNRVRQKAILKKMLELKMISESEYETALAEDPYSIIQLVNHQVEEAGSTHSYYTDQIIADVINDLQVKKSLASSQAYDMLYNKGLKIYSAVDLDIQKVVDDTFNDNSYFPEDIFEYNVIYYYTVTDANKVEKHGSRESVKTYPKTLKDDSDVEEFLNTVRAELTANGGTITKENVIKVPEPQASIAIIDYHTGIVKAIAGGRGEKPEIGRPFNRATQALRQPGSTFKVLAAYAPAIDTGKLTASTMLLDEPYSVNGHEFKNWYKGYRGVNSVRVGIQNSMNILALKTMMEYVGIDQAFNYLLNFGFTSLVDAGREVGGQTYSDRTPSLALGGLTDGVSPLELTAAYGAVANLGEHIKPIFYTKVLNHNGDILLDNTPEQNKVLKSSTAYILTDMMQDVITGGTGTQAKFKELDMPSAGKTGTTSETKDLVFAGYTPYYVGAVWLGFDQPKEVKNKGVYYHAIIWRDIMEKIHAGLPKKEFAKPESLAQVTICSVTGKLWSEGVCNLDKSAKKVTDYYSPGTEPKEQCDGHAIFKICSESNKLATPFCPIDKVKEIVASKNATAETLAKLNIPLDYCDIHIDPALAVTTETAIDVEITTEVPDTEIINFPESTETAETTQANETTPTVEQTEATSEEETTEPPIIIDGFNYNQ